MTITFKAAISCLDAMNSYEAELIEPQALATLTNCSIEEAEFAISAHHIKMGLNKAKVQPKYDIDARLRALQETLHKEAKVKHDIVRDGARINGKEGKEMVETMTKRTRENISKLESILKLTSTINTLKNSRD